ncbi:Beta-1,3-galactosyltransferase brn [Melipona quadrifasciata]|uniref:Hexosyltransferase n=1 Tax=Melipona quadrifasciata TaxID=166423 RepID=A0A0M8ZNQ2_9HYME|nr:Beta-1,3-galactosyltransferase brn [Melipona quadrifasciata]
MYCLLRPCFQTGLRLTSKIRLTYICIFISLIALLDFFGAFTHLFEITYDSNFVYPYEGDVHEFVNALRHNEEPAIKPINEYKYTFLLNNQQKCIDVAYSTFRVVYIVKSSIENFERRSAIRNSWGFEKRFFDVPLRTIFMLGLHPYDDELQAKVKIEAAKYKDIIQADFIDSYYNNTIKTVMGFKWLVKYCPNSKFYMFVDDDIYVSVKNVLRFIRNPVNYPDYLKEPKKIGFVFVSSPHRHKSSKWYISLSEYPYHLWPPYITAGAYILSKEALLDMYYTSLYTKHFKFDDIFLGIVAKKADIEPFHCEEFHFHKKDYTKFNYKYVITSHGYENPNELLTVWNEQKALGNA